MGSDVNLWTVAMTLIVVGALVATIVLTRNAIRDTGRRRGWW